MLVKIEEYYLIIPPGHRLKNWYLLLTCCVLMARRKEDRLHDIQSVFPLLWEIRVQLSHCDLCLPESKGKATGYGVDWQLICVLVYFSVAKINAMTKNNLEKKGFIWLPIPGHNPSFAKIIDRKSNGACTQMSRNSSRSYEEALFTASVPRSHSASFLKQLASTQRYPCS